MGSIDEDSIEMMSYIAQLTKNIEMTQNNERVTNEDYQKILPKLIWVLRDFQLELKDTMGNDISSLEYLNNAL
jgi:hypothetical protein